MGLYNFKERFAPFIIDGRKTHTIRAIRAHPDKPGNTLHLYTGLRTKQAKLLMRVPCVRVEEISIQQGLNTTFDAFRVFVEGELLGTTECEALARRDGFKDFAEMMQFWDGRLPFKGHIIHWRAK